MPNPLLGTEDTTTNQTSSLPLRNSPFSGERQMWQQIATIKGDERWSKRSDRNSCSQHVVAFEPNSSHALSRWIFTITLYSRDCYCSGFTPKEAKAQRGCNWPAVIQTSKYSNQHSNPGLSDPRGSVQGLLESGGAITAQGVSAWRRRSKVKEMGFKDRLTLELGLGG